MLRGYSCYNEVIGVELENKEQIKAKIVIIASGTYLDSRILVGHKFGKAVRIIKEQHPNYQKV